MRDPVGVVSKAHVIDTSALSSPSHASKELMGFTAVNFQDFEFMTREGGRSGGWSPEALELARVGKGVPQALLRNGIVTDDGEGSVFGQ